MKRTTSGPTAPVLVAVGVFLASLSAAAAEKAPEANVGRPRTISCSGTATVKVLPDAARLTLGVEATAPTVKEAHGEVGPRVIKVVGALAEATGLHHRLESSNVRVEADDKKEAEPGNQKADAKQPPEKTRFRVVHTLSVVVEESDPRKLSQAAGRLLEVALSGGANSAEPVEFFRKDLAAVEPQALTQAAADALANAKALASGAGVEVAEVLTVSDESAAPAVYAAAPGAKADQAQDATAVQPLLTAAPVEVYRRVVLTCSFRPASRPRQ
jgi:uncharacterized protein YggE